MDNWRIVPATPEDAPRLSRLMDRLESESDFMMYEVQEVPTRELLRRRLEAGVKTTKETFLLAIANEDIYGYALVFRGNFARNCGVGTLALGVARAAQGYGIGSALIAESIAWAKHQGLYRLQLQVQTSNTGAFRLYQKFGFQNEGTLYRCALVNGKYVDKYQMALLL
jgi:ribosomal protein S18 acetylase RimI-like enzyme